MNFKTNVEILLSKILEMINLWLREKLKKKKELHAKFEYCLTF